MAVVAAVVVTVVAWAVRGVSRMDMERAGRLPSVYPGGEAQCHSYTLTCHHLYLMLVQITDTITLNTSEMLLCHQILHCITHTSLLVIS